MHKRSKISSYASQKLTLTFCKVLVALTNTKLPIALHLQQGHVNKVHNIAQSHQKNVRPLYHSCAFHSFPWSIWQNRTSWFNYCIVLYRGKYTGFVCGRELHFMSDEGTCLWRIPVMVFSDTNRNCVCWLKHFFKLTNVFIYISWETKI